MILSQQDLRKAVEAGEIKFEPALEDPQWGEASVDLRLGHQFTKFKNISGVTISVAEGLKALGSLDLWTTKELKSDNGFGHPEDLVLHPGEFLLALTHESITVPRDMIALIEGRSTYARVGLSMHQTAPWIQPGWSGPIILEMMNHGPLEIKLTPTVDRPCQLTFFQLTSEVPWEKAYGARSTDVYQDQEHPLRHPSKDSR